MSKTTNAARCDSPMNNTTLVEQFVEFVDHVKENPQDQAHLLLPLLSEQNPVYRDRSTRELIRMRGYAMAAFELTGTPRRALPYVLEVLESEFHPYLVAAAACSLRGLERPHPQIAPYLVKAIYNVWENDTPTSFDNYRVTWPQTEFSTALTEIFDTLVHFGSHAKQVLPDLEHLSEQHAEKFSPAVRTKLVEAIDTISGDEQDVDMGCCQSPLFLQENQAPDELSTLKGISSNLVIQDQDGTLLEWGEFFEQKPTVLAFFYTRCENPRKCTQTIFNLANIRRSLVEVGLTKQVRVAAITYDPTFDSAEALKSYGDARNFAFDEDSRMLRVPIGFDQVVRAFRLGVNYTGSQVNTHRIELFLLNDDGSLSRSFLRIQSEPKQIVEAIYSLLSPSSNTVRSKPVQRAPTQETKAKDRFQAASSFLLGCLMVFLPKCPMCWVSYMSLFGVAGAESIPYSPWLLPVIVAILLINLLFLFRSAPTRNGYLPFVLSLIGSTLLILAIPHFGIRWTIAPGLGFLLSGSLLQSLSYAKFNKLKLFFRELQFRIRIRSPLQTTIVSHE